MSSKSEYALESKFTTFYTPGKTIEFGDSDHLICLNTSTGVTELNVLDCHDFKVLRNLNEVDKEIITTFIVCPTEEKILYLATSKDNQYFLQKWDWNEGKCLKTWKSYHYQPIVSMAINSTGTRLATGSALSAKMSDNSNVKIWHVGLHESVIRNIRADKDQVTLIRFRPCAEQVFTATGSVGEAWVRVWNSSSGLLMFSLRHVSQVLDMAFSADGNSMVTCSYKVMTVWNLNEGELDATDIKPFRTFYVDEIVTGMCVLPDAKQCLPVERYRDGALYVVTGGQTGDLKIWRADNGEHVKTVRRFRTCIIPDDEKIKNSAVVVSNDDFNIHSILSVTFLFDNCHSKDKMLLVTRQSGNVEIFNANNLSLKSECTGNIANIRHLAFCGASHQFLLLVQQSLPTCVKLFHTFAISPTSMLNNNNVNSSDISWKCSIMDTGHVDDISSINVTRSGVVIATGCKDGSIRVWDMLSSDSILIGQITWSLRVILSTDISNSVINACVFDNAGEHVFSIDQAADAVFCLRFWQVRKEEQISEQKKRNFCLASVVTGHKREVTMMALSPNCALLVTASRDKTIMLWSLDATITKLGVFVGHTKPVHSVQFSPISQAIVTASSDHTVRIWNIADFTCIKHFDLQPNNPTVHQAFFTSNGTQVLTSDENGHVKLWSLQRKECVQTMECLDANAWSLALHPDDKHFAVAGKDCSLLLWKDITEEVQVKRRDEEEKISKGQQIISNYEHAGQYSKALSYAIALDMPRKCLEIFKRLLIQSESGKGQLDSILSSLSITDIQTLLRYCVTWHQHSKNSHVSRIILAFLAEHYAYEDMLKWPSFSDYVKQLLPFQIRYCDRIGGGGCKTGAMLDYVLSFMRLDSVVDNMSVNNV